MNNIVNQNEVKDHPWSELSTFAYRAKSTSTGPLLLLLNLRNLIVYIRMNNVYTQKSSNGTHMIRTRYLSV